MSPRCGSSPFLKSPTCPFEPTTEEEMRALIKVCQRSRDFVHKRDEAIIRLFYDTGIRRNELANLREEDVNRDLGVVLVLGKGRRPAPRRSASRPP
jgi:integrase/recombinase XerC